MKVSKKLKEVKRMHQDSQFVDKCGRQFKQIGLHLHLYKGGHWIPLSCFSSEYPEKVWRIK